MTNASDKWLRGSAVLMLMTVATGCSEPASTAPSSGEVVGKASQALSATPDGPVENGLTTNSLVNNGFWSNGFWSNGFWSNGVSSNGFWSNGFWSNGFWSNGFWSNGFWSNGGSSNGFWSNGFWSNGTTGNGFWSNGFWSNGFWSNGFWSNGLQGDALKSNPATRQFLQYLYECAMPGEVDAGGAPLWATTIDTGEQCGPSEECPQFTVCQTVEAEKHCVVPLKGGIGLGINGPDLENPEKNYKGWWEINECDETCQRWVSACLLARTNAYGVKIGISLRVPDSAPDRIKAALQVDNGASPDSEVNVFSLREGAFYGNIFATKPLLPQPDLNNDGLPDDGQTEGPIEISPKYYACAGPGSNIPNLTKRFCSSQGFDGPITVTGECYQAGLEPASVCAAITDPDERALHHCQACEGIDEESKGAIQGCHGDSLQGDSTTYNEVITVYIHDLAEKCGNAVCEKNEETVSRQCVAGEVGMDAPFCCPSDCHPGTWARSWDVELGGAAADRNDGSADDPIKGSVVIAGTASGPLKFRDEETLEPIGTNDLVVAKYREDGSYLWARRYANTLGKVSAVAIADDGTIVLAGTNETTSSGWVAKLDKGTDATGAVTATYGDMLAGWPVTFHPDSAVQPPGRVAALTRLTVDHDGNVVGAGTFAGAIKIAGSPLDRAVGVFTFKFPSAGTLGTTPFWGIQFLPSSSNVSGLAVDSSNNVIVTLISGTQNPQSLLYKLAADTGAATLPGWTGPKSFPASKLTPGGVAADSTGAVYLTGSTLPIDFGGGPTHTALRSEFFLVKYAADGTYRWDVGEAASAATRLYSAGLRIAFDAQDNVVVGGQFGPGTVDLGNGLFNAHKSDDVFIASYTTTDGLPEAERLRWAKHVPMVLSGFFFGADVSESGRMYAAGLYSGSMMVDDRLLVSTLPESENYFQTFLASFAFPGSGSTPDLAPPELHDVPANMVVDAQGPDGTTLWYTPPTVIDGGYAGANLSCVPTPNSLFPLGLTPVTCTATDPLGHASAAQFTITVKDLRPPVIFDLPENQNVTIPSGSGAVVTFPAPFALDVVDGGVPVTCNHESGDVFDIDTTTVTCTATDAAGNSSSASFDVVVTLTDNKPPVIVGPSNITIGPVGPGGAIVTYTVSAIDDVDGSVAPTCSQDSGTLFHLGTTTVTCNASDAAGNHALPVNVDVVVADLAGPVISVPGTLTFEATGPSGALVTYSASAVDAVDAAVTPFCLQASGTVFGLGTHTVVCTAEDDTGNVAVPKSFVVIVQDKTAPVLTVPGPISVPTNGPTGAIVNFTVSATDAVTSPITPNCSRQSGSLFALGTTTVSCTATDAALNVSPTKTFTVTVGDTIKPVLTLPGTITVAPTTATGAVVKYTATATDNVDPIVTPVCSPASNTKFGLGKTTVKCTAKDKAGNVAEGTFDVLVQYSWSGFLQPINADGSSLFKLGRTVPVKFKLTGASKDIKNAVAKLTVAKLSGNVVGTSVEAISTSAADSGNQFRYDCGEYIFNLATKSLTTGTYQLSVDLGDGVSHTVKISLK